MSQELAGPAALAAGAIAGTQAAVQAVKEYTDLVLKPPLTELGGMAGDTFAAWRFRNQIKTVQKTMKFLKERKIDPQKLKPTIAVPLLEAAADTDDENLSDMFAQLLTAHLDPSRRDEVHPSFSKVMAQLSPLDAKSLAVIDEMRKELAYTASYADKEKMTRDFARGPVIKRIIKEVGGVTAGQVGMSLENLERLGLCEYLDYSHIEGAQFIGWLIPKYGHRFLLACHGKGYWRQKIKDSDDKRYGPKDESTIPYNHPLTVEQMEKVKRGELKREDAVGYTRHRG